jgi:hypothetical protein
MSMSRRPALGKKGQIGEQVCRLLPLPMVGPSHLLTGNVARTGTRRVGTCTVGSIRTGTLQCSFSNPCAAKTSFSCIRPRHRHTIPTSAMPGVSGKKAQLVNDVGTKGAPAHPLPVIVRRWVASKVLVDNGLRSRGVQFLPCCLSTNSYSLSNS